MAANKKPEPKSTRVNVRLGRKIKRKLDRKAAKVRRTTSDYVRLLIEKDLRVA